MLNIEINGKPAKAKKGETILNILKQYGISVPTLCNLENLSPTGACRLCVVEADGRLVPSCAFPVSEGMKIGTHTPRVMRARKTIVEMLLSAHPDDCLYCARNNECDLQSLARELGVTSRTFRSTKKTFKADASSPAIVRDPAKCILCGKCVRVCEEIQGVSAIDFIKRGSKTSVGTVFNQGLNVSTCINCGQCIMVCPTGALTETDYTKQVFDALDNPELHVVIQHAPSISVTIAEEFGMRPGLDADGTMTAALRRMGFDRVFETSFSADLTIMEEASELVHRLTTGGPLPLLTSCSPGWVKYLEQFFPDFIDNISTCKSPQQMLGAVIKSYYAGSQGINPRKIFSVSIMPCTAKKFECNRPEMSKSGIPDVDAVLTTREIAKMIRMRGLNLATLEPELPDSPFGERTTAGKIFGATGGVAEAAVRTAYYLVTGKELEKLEVKKLRGLSNRKEAFLDINGIEVGVAVVSGLAQARDILNEVRNGRKDIHFIEVMTCPGGCIAGGGQPLNSDPKRIAERMKALYHIDRTEEVRVSHKNTELQRLYDEFLGKPLGEMSHHLLHTTYKDRSKAG
ncbi:MAG: iron hydrogenase small subunit [Deltaproteobacteria bacterium]|nr:iron hydrogenase small subunit [Candidatus Zymogenaceae bacterium]